MRRLALAICSVAALAGCAGLDMPTPKEQAGIVAFCTLFWLPEMKENSEQIYTALPRSYREVSMLEVANQHFDSNDCVRDGAQIGTPIYAQCMATRKLARAQENANSRPTFVYGGGGSFAAGIPPLAPTPLPPLPVFQPGPATCAQAYGQPFHPCP